MSPKQIVRNPDILKLINEGYEVEVKNGYLLIHSVPYVNNRREIEYGIVLTDLSLNGDELLPPKDHQVWFTGDYPCYQNGAPIEALRNTSDGQTLWEGFVVKHRFSNKPFGASNYPDYSSKMINYITIIADAARAIADVTPKTFKPIEPLDEESVFTYHDSASTRADIVALSQKLRQNGVAIIGLGGTGSYILDFIAKSPIKEIHLFDGDVFLSHNAFRAPGAASKDVVSSRASKVHYFASIYENLRRSIVAHPEYITPENIDMLKDFDFVFICVDRGAVRKLICEFLVQNKIPFVDVGMDLQFGPDSENLIGTCRVTMGTPTKYDHINRHIPMTDEEGEDLYRRNIQVIEMNALNAALAVLQWKKLCGFYQDVFCTHHSTYSINSQSLTRDEMVSTEQ